MRMFLLLMIFCQSAGAAFNSTSLRYLSGHEVIAKLASVLPVGFSNMKDLPKCLISDQSKAGAGIINPGSGKSSYTEPSTAFLNWYLPCVSTAIESELSKTNTTEGAGFHLGPLSIKVEILMQTKYPSRLPFQIPAKEFSQFELEELVAYHVVRIIGPDEVIEEFGLGTTGQDMRSDVAAIVLSGVSQSSMDLNQLLQNLETEILSRDEFFIY